jgi:hypothetical protein
VPDENSYRFMADRSKIADDIATLLRNLSRRSSSSMHFMWAWFGAGKTHTLRHIEYLCKSQYPSIVPIYIEFPKSAKGFIDIFKSFTSAIDWKIVRNSYLEICTNSELKNIQEELIYDFPDLSNALLFLYQGTQEQQEIATRWLRTDYREKQILRSIGVVKPIQSAEDATKALSWLIRLISLGNQQGVVDRVLWMIDEYQRIEQLKKFAMEEMNGSLHSLFNRNPNGLTIIISFSGIPEEKKLPIWLSGEIKDRIGIEKPFLLPPLSQEEAEIFVEDVIGHFKDTSKDDDRLFPFTIESIREIIKILDKKAKEVKRKDEPKPRTLMHFFNAVLEEADSLIENGKMRVITKEFVAKLLEPVYLPPEN